MCHTLHYRYFAFSEKSLLQHTKQISVAIIFASQFDYLYLYIIAKSISLYIYMYIGLYTFIWQSTIGFIEKRALHLVPQEFKKYFTIWLHKRKNKKDTRKI